MAKSPVTRPRAFPAPCNAEPIRDQLSEFLDSNGYVWVKDLVDLPLEPGIYVVYGCDFTDFTIHHSDCVYVGQSKSLRKRVNSSHPALIYAKNEYKSYRVYYKLPSSGLPQESLSGELVVMECLALALFRPVLNLTTPVRRQVRWKSTVPEEIAELVKNESDKFHICYYVINRSEEPILPDFGEDPELFDLEAMFDPNNYPDLFDLG